VPSMSTPRESTSLLQEPKQSDGSWPIASTIGTEISCSWRRIFPSGRPPRRLDRASIAPRSRPSTELGKAEDDGDDHEASSAPSTAPSRVIDGGAMLRTTRSGSTVDPAPAASLDGATGAVPRVAALSALQGTLHF